MRDAKQAGFSIFNGANLKIAFVVSLFNKDITTKLRQSALARSQDYHIDQSNIEIFEVAGAIEIPLVLQTLAQTKKYDVLLAIGCVIKGNTPHFDYVCKFVTDGILSVQLNEVIPIGYGILTCNSLDQAVARQDLGGDHLDAVLQQYNVIQSI